MNTVKIQLISKNNSTHLGDEFDFDTNYVPRVGELFDATEYMSDGDNNLFIVNSVVCRMCKDKGFIPHIRATQFYHGLRADLLEEYGWLPQTEQTIKSYDEDNYNG
jgi:hypothetical protein